MWIPGSVLDAPALFLAGTASSMHCTLMCGAVGALNLPVPQRAPALAWLYGGRVAGYTVIGAAAGALGQSALRHLAEPAVGRALQAGAALALIMIGVRLLRRRKSAQACCQPPAIPLKAAGRSRTGLFARGVAWAAMPCPILYSLLLLAAFTGSAAAGGSLLGAFALGGTPALAAASWGLARRPGGIFDRAAGMWIVGFGILGLAAAVLLPATAAGAWCAGTAGTAP